MFNIGFGEILVILGVFVLLPTALLVVYSLGRRAGQRDARRDRR